MKHRFIIALTLLVSGALTAQNFQRTLSRTQTDFNHYSIELAGNGDYILAGTIFGPNGNDVHIVRMDAVGNVLCEQTLDLSPDDRALDVTEDGNGDIVITGYTTASGQEELLVANFDAGCGCNSHNVLQGFDYSAGTNIIWSNVTGSLFVGGLTSDIPFAVPLNPNNSAVIVEFDISLGLSNVIELIGADHMHTSVNDIIEVPNGLFVLGSVDDNNPKQGVLATFLDYSLSVTSNISFESTNFEHVGVSAVYDANTDQIYAMSNNSVIHNPQISIIDDVSGAPFVSNNYYLELDPTYGQHNAAGFELRQSIYDPDNLVAVGYFRTYDFGGAPFDNATPWLTEFAKPNGAHLRTVLYNAPSTNFYMQGGGLFSTFVGEHPYIFNSEILTETPNGDGYALISARLLSGNYSLDVVATDFDVSANSCLVPYSWIPQNISESPVFIQDNVPGIGDTQYGPNCSANLSDPSEWCTITTGNPCVSQNFQRTVSMSSTDHNHYSIETVGDCEYIIAGTEFKNNGADNDIHVMKVDDAGNLLWEQYINLSSDDRALDVMEDASGNYVVTGYTQVNGFEQLYLVKFDPNGNCLGDRIVTSLGRCAGTNLIYSQATGNYIVGGMLASAFNVPLTGSRAIVIEFTPALVNTGNQVAVNGPNGQGCSVNDIIEVPNGYFVTGSMDFTGFGGIIYQGVLAEFFDFNLNSTANASFESTNWEHVGVSAVYDGQTDNVYLMSNNSVIHNPQITIISNVSGSPGVASNYFLELDPTYGQYNAAGFELHISNDNPNDNLVAAGYFRTFDFGGAPFNNATPWVTEFEKNTGTHIRTILYNAPSTNFYAQGGGVFSTFSGEHPYIFNQEILTDRADGNGYVFLGARRIGGNYAVDIVSTDWNLGSNSCLDSYNWNPQNIGFVDIQASIGTPFISIAGVGAACQPENSKYSVQCNVTPKIGEDAFASDNAIITDGMTVYPNPTSDMISISIPQAAEGGELVIVNTLGKVVFSANTLADEQAINFDLSNEQSGLYFVIYTDDSQRMVSKVMKR